MGCRKLTYELYEAQTKEVQSLLKIVWKKDAVMYKVGFNGQERTDEWSGIGNHNTAEYWEYDTRTGRRWNLDPKPQISISDYAANGNNPILCSDPNGDIFGVDNLIGAALGATLELGTQITVNYMTGKTGLDLLDVDYADIAIEAGVGFATSGIGNFAKMGKTAVRIANAAKVAEKTIETSKVLKTTAKVVNVTGKNVIKASVDAKANKETGTIEKKIVGNGKDLKEAAIDLAAGVTGDASAKVIGGVINKSAAKATSNATTRATRAMTGSTRQAAAKSEIEALNKTIKGNAKSSEVISNVGSGAAAEKAKQ